MRSFAFRLQKVLEWEHTQRDLCEVKLQQTRKLLESVKLDLASLADARIRAGRETTMSTTLVGLDLAALAGFRAENRAEKRQKATLVALEGSLRELNDAAVKSRRRCNLLEKLKGRRQEEYNCLANGELESFAAENFLSRWRPVQITGIPRDGDHRFRIEADQSGGSTEQ